MKVAVIPDVPRISRQLEARGVEVRKVALGRHAASGASAVDVVVVTDAVAVKFSRKVFEKLAVAFPNTPWVFASDRLFEARVAVGASQAGALLTTIDGVPQAIASLERLMRPAPGAPRAEIVPEFHNPRTGRLDAGRIARSLGIPVSALARAVGVTASALSKRATARAAQEGLRKVEWVWATLRRMLGSDAAARAWLNAPHPDLGNQAPLGLLTEGSATALADYVRSGLIGQPT